MAAVVLLDTWISPHYAAPATGLVFYVLLAGLRRVRVWRLGGQPAGILLFRILMGMWALSLVCYCIQLARADTDPGAWWVWALDRARVRRELERLPGKHLAIVRYPPHYMRWTVAREWVYNAAEIDETRVVWARELGPSANRHLLRYFADRSLWLVEAGVNPPRVTPYPTGPPGR